ncbi:hypothetical protein Q5794_02305 [Priestia megaterium]
MDKALEAFRRGKLARINIDLFINKVRNMGDIDALENIKQKLAKGVIK